MGKFKLNLQIIKLNGRAGKVIADLSVNSFFYGHGLIFLYLPFQLVQSMTEVREFLKHDITAEVFVDIDRGRSHELCPGLFH